MSSPDTHPPSKSEVQTVLDGVHKSLLELLTRVEQASAQLDTLADGDELSAFVDKHVCDAKDTYQQQIQLWRQLLPNTVWVGKSLAVTAHSVGHLCTQHTHTHTHTDTT